MLKNAVVAEFAIFALFHVILFFQFIYRLFLLLVTVVQDLMSLC